MNGLKRRLRKRSGTEVFNSFTDYSNRFRQRFGIRQPEALELFYQTVSMKSVGNLTEFVRERMLGRTDIGDSIEGLVTSYADATAAHLAVQKARKQLEVLDPLMADDRSLEKVAAEITARQQLLTEVPRYFLRLRLHHHQQQLSRAQADWQSNQTERGRLAHELTDRQATRDNLRRALDGHSLQQRMLPLKHKIEELTRERDYPPPPGRPLRHRPPGTGHRRPRCRVARTPHGRGILHPPPRRRRGTLRCRRAAA